MAAERGKGPGELNTPHSIADDAKGNIYVGDRGNRRIQVFDRDGNFLREIKIDVPVRPDAKPCDGRQAGPRQLQADRRQLRAGRAVGDLHHAAARTQVLYSSDAYPGPHLQAVARRQGARLLGKSGKQPKQFGWIHEIACPSENELFVAELLNWRVQKLILHPEKMKAASRQ